MEQSRRTALDAAEAARRLGSDTHERRMAREAAELRKRAMRRTIASISH